MPKLEDLKVSTIRGMIKQYNDKIKISGYSKLKKAELISKLRNHPRLTITENSAGVKIKVKKEDDGRRLVRVGGRLIPQKKAQAEQTEKKPKVPKITITEADEPKRGGAAEPKSRLGPIPKSNVKIRVGPKKKKQAKQTESVEEPKRKPKKKNNNDEAGPAEPEPKPKPAPKKKAFELKPPKKPNAKYDFDFLRRLPRTRGLSRENLIYKELNKQFTEGQILDMNYLISKGGKRFKDLTTKDFFKDLPLGMTEDVEDALKRALTDIKKKAEKAPATKSKSLSDYHKGKGKQKAEVDTDTDDDDEPAPRMTAKQRKIQSLQREIGGLKLQIKNFKEQGKSTKFSEGQLKKKQAQLKSLQ